jgi:nucleoside-diphosphate-sugar epimerase
LVTGATGFLGGRTARLLRGEGHSTLALVRSGSDATRVGDLESQGVEIARGDITDRASVDRAMNGVDAVIHCAAWYELGVRDEARMERINVGGTRNVLEAAVARGVRVVHTSSVAALGPTGGKLADETLPHSGEFGSAYDRTKHSAHLLAREMGRSGAPVRIALPGTIFGPGDESLVALLFRAHLSGMLRLAAFPDTTMSLVHVDDCARGLLDVLEKGSDGREYILASHVVTFREWAQRLSEITGIAPPRGRIPLWPMRLASHFSTLVKDSLALANGSTWMFSGERARSELGWKGRELGEALAETLIAFDKNEGRRFRPTSAWGQAALSAKLPTRRIA